MEQASTPELLNKQGIGQSAVCKEDPLGSFGTLLWGAAVPILVCEVSEQRPALKKVEVTVRQRRHLAKRVDLCSTIKTWHELRNYLM